MERLGVVLCTGCGIGEALDTDALKELAEELGAGSIETDPAPCSPEGVDRIRQLAEQNDLIVTLPSRAAQLKRNNPRVVLREPPLDIPPLELKMAWSPLLHHNPAHRWLRGVIVGLAREVTS